MNDSGYGPVLLATHVGEGWSALLVILAIFGWSALLLLLVVAAAKVWPAKVERHHATPLFGGR